MPKSTMVLTTSLPSVTLRELSPADAPLVYELVQLNRYHLTSHGDYDTLVAANVNDIAVELAAEPTRHKRLGIFEEDDLVGRVDLVGVEPPRYGLGYWVAASHAGKGIGTAAVKTVVHLAFFRCHATDIFAGVTHGNEPSIALLKRLDFKPVRRFDTYTRFHLGAPLIAG